MNHTTFLQWNYMQNKQLHLLCYDGNQPAKDIKDLS